MSTQPSRRPFSVAEYDQMIATGILGDDDRVLVHTRPRIGQYGVVRPHALGDHFTSQRFPGVKFVVRDLLP
jgi:hypothetical protein